MPLSAAQVATQGQQPSEQQIREFCGNYGQLSESQQRQYEYHYEQYCKEPTFSQPVTPETELEQDLEPRQPEQQQQQQQQQQQPSRPEEPEAEPDIEPVRPEPSIPEPEPLRVDLVGQLQLDGPLARRPGERQAIQETDEGNNIACAGKVVALGQDRQNGDDNLSGLFGARVDEIREQQPPDRLTEPGLLRQSELDRMADMLTKTGGVQLVVDIDKDGVIDAGVSEGLKDRFGFLARPGLENILECMNQAVAGGVDAATDLIGCLSGGTDDGNDSSGGPGSGPGDGPSSHLADALQPECGSDNPATTGYVHDVREIDKPIIAPIAPESMTPDETFEEVEDWGREVVATYERAARQARESGESDLNSAYTSVADAARAVEDAADRGLRTEQGSRKRGEAKEDLYDAVDELQDELDQAAAEEKEHRRDSKNHGKSMPGPGPGGTTPGGGSDPRCEEPSMWTMLHSERCASNMADCLKRMSDPVYAETGGRCRTTRGPDDAERIECQDNDSVANCIENGGSPQECAERRSGEDRGTVRGEDDQIFESDRGSVGYGVMDVHPFGATLAAMCRKAGGAGPCGDPAPTMEASDADLPAVNR